MTRNTENVDVFSSFKLGPLDLPNRMVMAPMTRNRAGSGEVPGPISATYYTQRASAGLIVTEATQISRKAKAIRQRPAFSVPRRSPAGNT